MRNVALDWGARKIAYCELHEDGEFERHTVRGLDGLKPWLGPHTPPARVVIEACREAWHVHDVLTGWGHEVLLADTTRTRRVAGVGDHGRKNDRLDAEALVVSLARNQIPRAHVLSPARRELRAQINVRRVLVETRSKYISITRGILRGYGVVLPLMASETFLANVKETKLAERVRAHVAPLIAILESLEVQMVAAELRLEQLCNEEPAIQHLMTIPGVGRIVAATFVSCVDEAKRFKHAHQVQSYFGVVPGESSSGGKRRIGSITKAGNWYMRAVLTEAAWAILRKASDDPIAVWAKAIEQRRGRGIAIIALSRRLIGVMWALWKNGTVYEPARVGLESATGMAQQAQSIEVRAKALKRASQKAIKHTRGIRRAEERIATRASNA